KQRHIYGVYALIVAKRDSIFIVVESEILVSGPTNLADSFLLLFGYVYALDLQYPEKMELTMTFFQKVVMCLEDNKPLRGRLLTLKNALFSDESSYYAPINVD
uniref:Uncharacterized protein n=1 Tax=Oryzias melastigma TaxID=30732 RepID=A0A3B3C340_ORYME